ncbi:MAG: alpha/beta fold hydrolase [Rhodopseudomonas palustris]|uniref:Alpha/beta fold hydrolase n=1 Tax=Rhodopseudomonas palustris TaxID=1076 RepID=A0A933RXC5_RHOPL|nr:alpha/beta fold hydrolase [Rhodopseudomonas palustris]
MSRTFWLCILVLSCLTAPARSAGVQLLDSDPRLEGAIWYPCVAEPRAVELGRLSVQIVSTIDGVKDCPLTATKLPLVVLSHGRGGWFAAHIDVAEALADAGFVVAAINHPGDNGNDSSKRDTLSLWQSRPDDIVRLIDYVLNDWKDRAAIDRTKIGLFGFSLGGATGFLVAGVKPDFDRLARVCNQQAGICAQLANGEAPPAPSHDSRIRAAVIVDPPSTVFTADNLAAIGIPLQFWRSEQGGGGVDPAGTSRVAAALPGKPEIHAVPAGHYAFLAPCTPQFAVALPRFCSDPAGFDRLAFHREFDATIVRFFKAHLVDGNPPR